MKKFFTLIAMAAMAIGANAQVWKVNADTPVAENSTWLDDDFVTVKTTFAGTIKEAEATIAGEAFTHYAQVRVDKAPSADALYGTDKGGSTALIITPKQDVTYTIYYRRQKGDWTSNDGKDVKVIDQADPSTVLEGEMTIDSKTEDGDYGFATKVISLKAGKTYTVWAKGTTLNYYGMKFEAAGGQQGGNEGQGGQQPSGDVEKYVAAPEGVLAAEFAAVVDGENATNVVDGKSVVTITTDNVTLEAVGGATPANVDGGAQDITPGTVVDAEKHLYEVASVGSWNNVTWKNGQNKTDINDEAGTKLYFVLGSGNPYVKMYAEEIVTDDTPTGTYRASYDYYKPGMDMPQVGLYYKFTTKTDGKMKVQIWANKGNRNTYLINGQTKEAVAYQATGYVNGQKVVDENNEKVLNAEGQEMMRLFTPEEIQERHNAAKVGEDGVDSAPYVIDQGGQPFWGWIIFEAKAGVDYWLFQDSSQVGFGGFEFTAGAGTGIREIVNVKNDANAPVYNLAGQRVSPNTKGILIKNGKIFINK
jgi:hypothetical protein